MPSLNFKDEIHKREAELIAQALEAAEGSVTKASRLLGFNHHQSLISLLNTKHRDLLGRRSKITPHRKRLITRSKDRRCK